MQKVALLCAADLIQTNLYKALNLMNATTNTAHVIALAILFGQDR